MTLLLASALRASVILALAWAGARLLGAASAAVRHRLWAAALAAVAVLPGLLWLAPVLMPSPSPLVVLAQDSAALVSGGGRALPWLEGLWIAGVLLIMGRLMLGLLRIARISRSAHAVNGVRYSTRIASPMTWGWWRPVILVPAYAADWSVERRALLIRHEQAHIERHDWAWHILGQVVGALLWFHPLVWVANAALRRESDGAADDRVLLAGAEPSFYATQLLAVARHINQASSPAAVWMVSRPPLERRLGEVLNVTRRRGRVSRTSTLAIIGVVAMVSLPLAAAQGGRIYQIGDAGVTPPRVVSQVKPQYTQAALDAKIQGTVLLDVEVTETGAPDAIRLVQTLDDGLDANAVSAARRWRFAPGRKDGMPVRVEVKIEMTFTLK